MSDLDDPRTIKLAEHLQLRPECRNLEWRRLLKMAAEMVEDIDRSGLVLTMPRELEAS